MRHTDANVLALLALGEQVGTPAEREHALECAECASELDELRHAVTIGRATLVSGRLETPGPRVWSRVREQLGLAGDAVDGLDTVERPAGESVDLEPPIVLADRRRRMPMTLIAAAAAVMLAVGGVATWQFLRPADAAVLATATLDPFPNWPGASGTATLEKEPDGARIVRVSIDTRKSDDGYREVWLMTADATSLISLGTVRGRDGAFTVPDGVDLARYDIVDISAEPLDGNPAHSGDSIVRGPLRS